MYHQPIATNQYQPTDTTTKHHLNNDVVLESPKVTKKKRRFLTCSAKKRKRCTSRCFEELSETTKLVTRKDGVMCFEKPQGKKNKWRIKNNSLQWFFRWFGAFFFSKTTTPKKKCCCDFFWYIGCESKLLLRGILRKFQFKALQCKSFKNVPPELKLPLKKKRAASYNLSLLHVGHPQWSFRCFVVTYANVAFIWHPPAKEFPPLPNPCWLRESLNSWTEVLFGVAYYIMFPPQVLFV